MKKTLISTTKNTIKKKLNSIEMKSINYKWFIY